MNNKEIQISMEVPIMNFAVWVWEGIRYILGVLGNVITFKLYFIFLLVVAFYLYKLLCNVLSRGTRNKARSTEK